MGVELARLEGKRAFITGAASGIGLGIARTLGRRGVNIVLADIDREALLAARAEVEALGVEAMAVPLDVTERSAFETVAADVTNKVGAVHILVNNAGVAVNSHPIETTDYATIDWLMDVNVNGVINGLKAFIPSMIAGGEGGHIVNTASIGGFYVRDEPSWHLWLYNATKYAVVALSEGLRIDLAPYGIGVSVFAPSGVETNIRTASRNRQERYGGPVREDPGDVEEWLRPLRISPDAAGERVLTGMVADAPYIFTDTHNRHLIAARHDAILREIDAVEQAHAVGS